MRFLILLVVILGVYAYSKKKRLTAQEEHVQNLMNSQLVKEGVQFTAVMLSLIQHAESGGSIYLVNKGKDVLLSGNIIDHHSAWALSKRDTLLSESIGETGTQYFTKRYLEPALELSKQTTDCLKEIESFQQLNIDYELNTETRGDFISFKKWLSVPQSDKAYFTALFRELKQKYPGRVNMDKYGNIDIA